MNLTVTCTRTFEPDSPFFQKFLDISAEYGPKKAQKMIGAWMSMDGSDYFLGVRDDHSSLPEWEFQMEEDG